MRAPSANAKSPNSLKELIAVTTRLWRNHYLTYDQARYVSKEVGTVGYLFETIRQQQYSSCRIHWRCG